MLICWAISKLWLIYFLECAKVLFVGAQRPFWCYFPIKNKKLGGVTFFNCVDSVSHFQVMANLFPRMGQSPFLWAQRPFWYYIPIKNKKVRWSHVFLIILIGWAISKLWQIYFLEWNKVPFLWAQRTFWWYFPVKNEK